MSEPATRLDRVHPMRSLFFKTALVVAFCTVGVVAAIEVINTRSAQQRLHQAIMTRATEMTDLLALQLGGAIKFKNHDALSEIVAGTLENSRPDAVAAVAVDAAGTALQAEQGPPPEAELLAFAREAAENGGPVVDQNRLIMATPVTFGGENLVVGAIATRWTDEFILADYKTSALLSLLAGLVALLCALAGAAYLLYKLISVPLAGLGRCMGGVAQGDYETGVPHTARRDEIGMMAAQLEALRAVLRDADEAAHETAFKSAAFAGSSASLMMVDRDFRVIFANPACEELVKANLQELTKVWPGVSGQTLIGADLRSFEPLRGVVAQVEGGALRGGTEAVQQMVQLGERLLRITLNAALGQEGELIGSVIEWTDRTDAQRNAALHHALDSNQLTVEYNLKGKIQDANQNFLDLIDGTKEDTRACNLATMFAKNIEGDEDGSKFVSKVISGEPMRGRFNVFSFHAQKTFVIDGSFSVLTDHQDKPHRLIFLGNDVTEQDHAMRAAEAAREESAAEQANVVALLGDALNKLANGDLRADLTSDVPASYEKLRRDFNGTVDSLREAMSAVMHNSDSIRNETAEITSAADDLSRRTEKQAATLEETAAALDELTVSVRSAAEGADDASRMSAEAQKNAQQGGDIARQAVAAMDGIRTSSQEISKITSVIDDIAFQTNLLALNAGVEAARAGEAGRGFAVVATEVRALAQRSSDAAREINALISSSGEQVSQGVDLVDRTGSALAAIVTSVSEISNRVSNIASSAREQSSGLAEINTAVNELDHVTQQNAAMFEETTAASHALTAEADALAAAVARFRLNGETAVAAVSRPAAAPVPVAQPRVAAPATQGNAALDMSQDVDADGWEEF
ncbi:methyl-accepting chemotaxis protein [Sulfitobacter sp. EhC04]|uniref:methyl-accepting chemotaxis protein n=1 Tax=Sulfitobacter sp. EhC04 TaxID=1849168 RepID=UPI000A90072B|nr:methyl-accepting chemotaxis protein [Sulfitobacter sp. EhC04]